MAVVYRAAKHYHDYMKKLLAFVPYLLLIILLLTKVPIVQADVLPLGCSSNTDSSTACRKAQTPEQCWPSTDSYSCTQYLQHQELCVVTDLHHSAEADAALQKERDKDPRCSGYATNNKTPQWGGQFVCSRLIYSCASAASIFGSRWFYLGLGLTILSELVALYLLSRFRKMLLTYGQMLLSVPVNIVTNTLLTLTIVAASRFITDQMPYVALAVLLEVVVVFVEAYAYKKLLKRTTKDAFVLSAVANSTSIVAGIVVSILVSR
jgi:hypothetical protein